MAKKVSIYDVAKYCKVSAASVSYVINGKNKVSTVTKRKILQAIDELGFVMDTNARTLSTGKSHLIGVFLPLDHTSRAFMQNPFYAEFLGGLESGIASYDYDIVIGCKKNYDNFKNWATSRGLDGVIMLGQFPKNVYEAVKKLNIPVVLIDIYEEYASEFYNVRINDEQGTYNATKYLIENGHKKIGFAGSIKQSLVDKKRYDGYLNAMKENKLPVEDDYYFDAFATFDDGIKTGEEILKRNNVTAIICTSDIIAIGINRKYFESNKKIPHDLSIVGFDDIQDTKYVYPSITTVHQDIYLKGEIAAKTILNVFLKKKNITNLFELNPSLIIRESVAKVN